ncbi:MAG: sugar transferase [Lewinellaceae bacterium]|nr:sugar transferase [Lewinellaceae bacterium]
MYGILKRLFDITLSALALLILSPVFLFFIPVLRFSGEGEVWYRQKRVGYKNQYFYILKFATMLKNSPNMGTGSLTTRNDPRVLPVGRFLRKTKLNELPQLVNVLRGDMSFVGPRPQMEVDFLKFPAAVQARIYDARPGITGIGSIVFRDEEKLLSSPGMDPHAFYEQHIAPYKGALELWYQQHASLFTDLLLLFLTAWVVFFPNSKLHFRLLKGLPPAPEWIA